MNNTLRQIGFLALSRLFNSARFRPQDKDADFRIVDSKVDFDLTQLMQDNYRRDHDSDYRAGQDYAVWGIELGYQCLAIKSWSSFADAIIEQVVPHNQAPLPSHFIVKNWSNSDHGSDASYIVFRLSNAQDEMLRKLQTRLPEPVETI